MKKIHFIIILAVFLVAAILITAQAYQYRTYTLAGSEAKLFNNEYQTYKNYVLQISQSRLDTRSFPRSDPGFKQKQARCMQVPTYCKTTYSNDRNCPLRLYSRKFNVNNDEILCASSKFYWNLPKNSTYQYGYSNNQLTSIVYKKGYASIRYNAADGNITSILFELGNNHKYIFSGQGELIMSRIGTDDCRPSMKGPGILCSSMDPSTANDSVIGEFYGVSWLIW